MAKKSGIVKIQEISKTARWRKRLATLRAEQTYWMPQWRELVANILPRRGRYLSGEDVTQDNDGRKKAQKILNGCAQKALKVMAAGLMNGTTSPSRPWISLSLADEDLAEHGPVRDWLHECTDILHRIFNQSNYYTAHHYGFSELGGFGTNCMMIEEDDETVIRCRPFTIGEYCLTQDSSYRPESLYRQFMMTAGQIQEKFCSPSDPFSIDEKKLPTAVKSALSTNNYDQRFQVVHVIEKNSFVRADNMHGKPYRSVYFMLAGDDQDLILRDHGYSSRPFIATRWEVDAVDTYGSGCGHDALADIKMFYKENSDYLKAWNKYVDPPMVGPTSLKSTGGTIVSGGVTYIDTNQGQQGFVPAYQINPNFDTMMRALDRTKQEVKEWFYNDLFLAFQNSDGTQKTAYEIARKNDEKIAQIGPVWERLQTEDLNPTVDRVWTIAKERGLLPPPPADLKPGMPLRVKYISAMAMAMKAVGLMPIEQTLQFVMETAKVFPTIVDGFDFDEALVQYSTINGTPSKIIRDKKGLQAVRAQNAKQKQMEQMAAMTQNVAKPGAEAVSSLANAPVQSGQSTALDQIMKAMPGNSQSK